MGLFQDGRRGKAEDSGEEKNQEKNYLENWNLGL
jgi:hypothetical protein